MTKNLFILKSFLKAEVQHGGPSWTMEMECHIPARRGSSPRYSTPDKDINSNNSWLLIYDQRRIKACHKKLLAAASRHKKCFFLK